MSRKLTKRDREKLQQKQINQSLKAQRMLRGDKKQEEQQKLHPEPVVKPLSESQRSKFFLENLTSSELPQLINDKFLYSNTYYKTGASVEKSTFDRNNNYLENGIIITFPQEDSQRSHYFGFQLINHYSGNKLQIHYQPTYENRDIVCCFIKEVNLKRISARTLIDMIGEDHR
jgi:hypothetical protein